MPIYTHAVQYHLHVPLEGVHTICAILISHLQAVEYFAEWALSPFNVVFQRVQTGVFDPLLIGDKSKWYSNILNKIDFRVYDDVHSTLGAAVQSAMDAKEEDENPTGEASFCL